MPFKLALAMAVAFFVCMYVLMWSASCPKAPPPYDMDEEDSGQEVGVVNCEEDLSECEENLIDARNDMKLWKQMAEGCVAQKAGQ